MTFKLTINFIMIAAFTFSNHYSQSGILKKYDFNSHKVVQSNLPAALDEISGLTVIEDDRVFCHNDEKGIVFQIDVYNGYVIKFFDVGKWRADKDFEGIAFADGFFYLVTSSGELAQFKEGGHKQAVDYKVINTGLSSSFNVEGLCYDEDADALLLACKDYAGKNFKNKRAVYEFSLKTFKINPNPQFIIDFNELKEKFGLKEFNPSGIVKNVFTGTYFLISAKGEKAVLEISPDGNLLSVHKLDKDNHSQPEGIAFLSGGTMLIADEKNKKKHASITAYPLNLDDNE